VELDSLMGFNSVAQATKAFTLAMAEHIYSDTVHQVDFRLVVTALAILVIIQEKPFSQREVVQNSGVDLKLEAGGLAEDEHREHSTKIRGVTD
jgi:hypothetical protein